MVEIFNICYLWTLNMRLNRLTFSCILTKSHVDHFSVNHTFISISEGVLLKNLSYFCINASIMHWFLGKNVRFLHVTGSIWENPVQTRYSMLVAVWRVSWWVLEVIWGVSESSLDGVYRVSRRWFEGVRLVLARYKECLKVLKRSSGGGVWKWSTLLDLISLGSKIFCITNWFEIKHFWPNFFRPKAFGFHNFFWLRICWTQILFGHKIFGTSLS